jgi:GxxExxY protein
MLNDEVDRLAERVIGCAIEVHRTMGPGLLESIYRECLQMELDAQRIPFDIERLIAVDYKGRPLKARLRIDLLVEEKIVLELKAVEALRPVHKAQVITYLKLTGYPAGLLINFNEVTLRAGLNRLDHPDRYKKGLALRCSEESARRSEE